MVRYLRLDGLDRLDRFRFEASVFALASYAATGPPLFSGTTPDKRHGGRDGGRGIFAVRCVQIKETTTDDTFPIIAYNYFFY